LLLALLLFGCRNAQFFPGTPAQPSRLEHVTAATFEDRVLKCDKPVLVDFYAEWCGPCKKLEPLLEDFSDDHAEIRVVQVNVDENADLARRYRVEAMPTLLVIRDGQEASRSVGLIPKQNLAQLVQAKAAM
jgi:thioredoxin 1